VGSVCIFFCRFNAILISSLSVYEEVLLRVMLLRMQYLPSRSEVIEG
jgi:hypothetical protein